MALVRPTILHPLVLEGERWGMLTRLEAKFAWDLQRRMTRPSATAQEEPPPEFRSYVEHVRNFLAYWLLILKSPEDSFSETVPRSAWIHRLFPWILMFLGEPEPESIPLDQVEAILDLDFCKMKDSTVRPEQPAVLLRRSQDERLAC